MEDMQRLSKNLNIYKSRDIYRLVNRKKIVLVKKGIYNIDSNV